MASPNFKKGFLWFLIVGGIIGVSWLSWSYWASTRPLKSIRVVLFDSSVNPHPSPKDSAWDITDPKIVARIRLDIHNANRFRPPIPLAIGVSGYVELRNKLNRTETFSVCQTRRSEGVCLGESGGTTVFLENDKLLPDLEKAGVPMDRFFYHDPPIP